MAGTGRTQNVATAELDTDMVDEMAGSGRTQNVATAELDADMRGNDHSEAEGCQERGDVGDVEGGHEAGDVGNGHSQTSFEVVHICRVVAIVLGTETLTSVLQAPQHVLLSSVRVPHG